MNKGNPHVTAELGKTSLAEFSDTDLIVLYLLVKGEEDRYKSLDYRLQGLAPRDAGVSDTVYEYLCDFQRALGLLHTQMRDQLDYLLEKNGQPLHSNSVRDILEDEIERRKLSKRRI